MKNQQKSLAELYGESSGDHTSNITINVISLIQQTPCSIKVGFKRIYYHTFYNFCFPYLA